MDERVQKLEEKQPRKYTAQRLDTIVPEFNLQNIWSAWKLPMCQKIWIQDIIRGETGDEGLPGLSR